MKTLINKRNSQIRITAEVETLYDKYRCVKYYYVKDLRLGLLQDNWTLVEEEQPEEICSKCVYHKKDDDYCYNPYGGMRRRINENGVCECTGFCEKEKEEPKRKQSPALKKIVDNLTEEKLAKTRAEMKLEDAAEPVDLDEDIEMQWDSFIKHTAVYGAGAESEDVVWLNWFSFGDIARHFYELGRKGGK